MPLTPEQFGAALEKIVAPEDRGSLHTLPSGMALLAYPDGHFKVLGCPTCLGASHGQDARGYPTIGGVTLISAEESPVDTSHLGDEVRANLWMCPQCGMAQLHLLPAFGISIGVAK